MRRRRRRDLEAQVERLQAQVEDIAVWVGALALDRFGEGFEPSPAQGLVWVEKTQLVDGELCWLRLWEPGGEA